MSSKQCGFCLKGFSNNAYRLICNQCLLPFHLDCQNLKKEDYAYYKESKKPFFCCRCNKGRRGSLPTAENSGDDKSEAGESPDVAEPTMSQLLKEIRALSKSYANHTSEYKHELKDLKDHLNKYSDAIERNTDTINRLCSDVSAMSESIGEVKQRCTILEKKVTLLEGLIWDNEQSALNNCVEIAGVPEVEGENVIQIVTTIGAALKVEIPELMISNCFRRASPAHSNQFGQIFVSFLRKTDKDKLIKASRMQRNLTSRDLNFISGESSKIYINHSLTFNKRKLLNAAKIFRQENHFKYVWVKNGNIFVRKDEGTKAYLIRTTDDLKNEALKNDGVLQPGSM
ncbi:unnamed protein product, partial [Nesidiocoris tenuis]